MRGNSQGPRPGQERPGVEETVTVGVALAVVFVVSIILAWVIPARGSFEWMPDAPAAPDRVPSGPIVRTLPKGCGISAATVGRLVTEPRMSKDGGQGECVWSSRSDEGSRRFLSIGLSLSPGATTLQYAGMTRAGRSAVGEAMRSFGAKWSGMTDRRVTGLGDEALVQSSPSNGVTVVARTGNTKVIVQYRGIRLPLPEQTALDGALAAAAEVVTGLGAGTPARPVIAPAPRSTPARTVPDLCTAVSDRTLRRLLKGPIDTDESRSTTMGLVVEGARYRGCSWTSMDSELKVITAVVPGGGPFDGTWLATREYVIRHGDARAEEPLSVRDRKYFRPVAGLGDQAYTAHVPGVIPAVVLFRDGNVLVQVTYEEADERHPIDGKHAMRGAYAAAKEVAPVLSGR
ncbi:hypothetical protein [Spirillospora sp. NPDC047279]|uniref:hypothetical protein n=1 Tax=Spirillospora sp. NPDC047279 TaxID=3155478 RepID=UPI00340C36DD